MPQLVVVTERLLLRLIIVCFLNGLGLPLGQRPRQAHRKAPSISTGTGLWHVESETVKMEKSICKPFFTLRRWSDGYIILSDLYLVHYECNTSRKEDFTCISLRSQNKTESTSKASGSTILVAAIVTIHYCNDSLFRATRSENLTRVPPNISRALTAKWEK
jgi:hypothetical protein